MKNLLALASLLFAPLSALNATEFHISPSGDDTNPGAKELPFATLERARDVVRELNAAKKYLPEGITVWLRGGVYQREQSFDLDARDGGQASAPVVYAASPGETVRLVGGRKIQASAFHPVTDRAFLDRVVSHAARRHLLQVDLKALGITDYGELQPMHALDFGSPTHYLPAPLELFIDGKAATLARWPNRNDQTPTLGLVERYSEYGARRERWGGAVFHDHVEGCAHQTLGHGRGRGSDGFVSSAGYCAHDRVGLVG
jgi:hypothetical protein